MANECIPLYDPGAAITGTASSNVTGKRFVGVTTGLNATNGTLVAVAHATSATKPLGVAVRDAASGARVLVESRPGAVVPVTAGGTIAANAEVEVGSNGQAVTLASGKPAGQALSAGTSGNDVFVRLY